MPHAAPGDHEHPPHGGDRPPHPPRRVPGSVPEGPRDAPGQPGGDPPDGLPLGADDRGGAAGRRARPGRGPGLGCPIAERLAPSWRGSPRPRPSPCSRRPSATVPTTCPPANRSGHALGILDRPEEALRAFEEVLRIEPGRELTLRSSGRAAGPPATARPRARGAAKDDRGQPLALGLSPGVGPGLLPGRGLARSRRGLPRGDPAQPRAVRGAVAPGPVLPAVPRAREGRRRVPDLAPLLPRQPRGLAAVVSKPETGGATAVPTPPQGARLELLR